MRSGQPPRRTLDSLIGETERVMVWVIVVVVAVVVALALGLRRVRRAPSLTQSTRASIEAHEVQANLQRGTDKLGGGDRF